MLEGIIPGVISHTNVIFVGIELSNLIRASRRVRNTDLSATTAGIEAKTDLFRHSATELEIVVLTCQQGGRETRHPLLASVESIPDMVHHSVQGVVEAGLLVLEEHRLNGTIPSIVVEILEHHEANIGELAHIDLLVGEVSAARVSSTYGLVIRHNHKVWRGLCRLGRARVDCASKSEYEVVGSSAWEVTAVRNVGPTRIRLLEEGPSHIINILESNFIEEVRWNLVRVVMVALKNNGSLTTL